MIETKVTCDGCGRELDITTSYTSEAYVEMKPVYKAGKSNFRFAMDGDVPINKSYQFHDLECVKLFVDK